MALCKLVRSNYGGKLPVSIKHENVHSFKEGILLCQSILKKKRRVSHLSGSAHFTIPLRSEIFKIFGEGGKNLTWGTKHFMGGLENPLETMFTNPDNMSLSCTETILIIVSTHSLKLIM